MSLPGPPPPHHRLAGLSDGWAAIDPLLDEALDLPPEDRAAWLAALPAAAAPHRAALARLLAAQPAIETDDFLDELPRFGVPRALAHEHTAAATGATDLALAAGGAVGPYRLLEAIGSGGMGAVWLAERSDGQPRRKVALKLPHMGWQPGLAARLERERDILASLEHPNIARLYDAGLDAFGRPYLAMEYVAGTPIDRYVAARALPLPARLHLVLQVAAAVAHAHTRLVAHRDLKPANILVSDDGDVRLLDFGIAGLVANDAAGESALTRESGRALTPDYASPEQIRGEPVGTASDVYSLGVVAYEVVTGTRPYRLGTRGGVALAEAIAAVQLQPASSSAIDPAMRRAIGGDLDAVLAKSLRQDPAERYPTVEAFATDIGRCLRGEPVSAQPDRIAYRVRKFVGRHRWQAGSAALAVVALVGGAGVALWQAREARQEAARAEQVKAFVLSLLDSADSDAGAGARTTAVELLQAASKRVERELAGRPGVAAELMTAIGFGLLGQGRAEDAAGLLNNAVALSAAAHGSDDRRTLAARVVYGEALVALGRNDEAIGLMRPAAELARRLGDGHAEIDARRWLSSALLETGDVEGGVAAARQAIAVLA
ncbi:MAG: serine/threonine-protein kinase, partial [Caldimonas sp.]